MCENCTWVHVYFPDRFKGQRGVHYTYTDRKHYLILLSKHSNGEYHQFIFITENNLTLCTGKRLVEDSWDRQSMRLLHSIISVTRSSEELLAIITLFCRASRSYLRQTHICKTPDTGSATEVTASTKNTKSAGYSHEINYTAVTSPQNRVMRYCVSEKHWASQNLLETEHVLIFAY